MGCHCERHQLVVKPRRRAQTTYRRAEAQPMRKARTRAPARIALALVSACAAVVLGFLVQTSGWSAATGSAAMETGSEGSQATGTGRETGSTAQGRGGVGANGASGAERDSGATAGTNAAPGGATALKGLFSELEGPAGSDGCVHAEVVCVEDVPDAATDLLNAYRSRQDCLLAQSGYLDLYGEAWGCVIQGGAWVDVCVVRGDAEETRSMVSVVRMDVAVWEKEVVPTVVEGSASGAAD